MSMQSSNAAIVAMALVLGAGAALAQSKYDPGASDTEIVIGQTNPYSGPLSSYSTQGRVQTAYYAMINEQGGVNGRKIKLISLDDGYSPPRTVEQHRKMVEEDNVLAIVGTMGTPTNSAIIKYMNAKQVPQIFIATGASKWGANPTEFPWTMGWYPTYRNEGVIYGKYIVGNIKDAKIGVIYQNDDYGKDHITGLKAGFGDKVPAMLVAQVPYESTDPTIDSQIVALKESGADVLVEASLPKFAAQSIRKIWDIGWKPLHIVSFPAASIPLTLKPAGLDKSAGLVTAEFLKEPGDPAFADDPEVRAYREFLAKYYPEGDPYDWSNVIAYYHAGLVVHLLAACGDDLTRENVMSQAAHMDHVHIPLLLPGITINTSPTDYSPIKQMRLKRFDGERWVPFGEIIEG